MGCRDKISSDGNWTNIQQIDGFQLLSQSLLDAVWFILQPIRFLLFVSHKHLPPAKKDCSFNPLDQHMGWVEGSRDMHLMFWISINGNFVNTLH
jgi:hypothetical protein